MKKCQAKNRIKNVDTPVESGHLMAGDQPKPSVPPPPLFTYSKASCSRMKKTTNKKQIPSTEWADKFFAEVGLDPETRDEADDSDTLSERIRIR